MDTHSKNSNHSYFASTGTLNNQLADIHQRLRVAAPEIDRISFALYDDENDHLKTYADSTFHGFELMHYEFPLSELPTLKICSETGECRYLGDIPNQLNAKYPHTKWLIEQGYHSSLAVPVFQNKRFIGFIFLNSCKQHLFNESITESLKPFLDIIRFIVTSEYDLVHSLIDSASLVHSQSREHWQESSEHKERISRYAKVIALEVAHVYELDDEIIENIALFSKCHDIGKLSVPASLLTKSSSLGNEERDQLKDHVEKGVEMINQIIEEIGSPDHPCVSVLKEIVAYHHEFLDGSGYPYGLTQEDIPISARIITVANVFDALTSHRPYKQAWSVPFALLELEKMVANGKLDKHCVNGLRYHQEYLKRVIEAYPEPDPKDRPEHH
ncbi:HD-GYP domain-containing protein [Vibrio ziniensis]|uniref:HD domain-containing protein n=1 Tax=Vibrio ziniensis TaxID=2711221 RepID=A0A6G7CFY9_9VIBR|nr:HD domain-containing phosphohydrolase [Vibrio ziniensis]QIH40983.1 HD domain-containing protein [Vibrio ziniensis]